MLPPRIAKNRIVAFAPSWERITNRPPGLVASIENWP